MTTLRVTVATKVGSEPLAGSKRPALFQSRTIVSCTRSSVPVVAPMRRATLQTNGVKRRTN
jgi:hypothetical protein